jgi:DnaJ-class molecular chaperone
MIGPTDGNLDALRRREEEREAYEARFIDCPECEGTGEIEVPLGFHTGNPDTDDWDVADCEECGGTGEIEAEEEDALYD